MNDSQIAKYEPSRTCVSVFSEATFENIAFNFWTDHLGWLYRHGFSRAFNRVTTVTPSPTGHEVVELLHKYIELTGYANAHFGLTSSDIVDNVRLVQYQAAVDVITSKISEFVAKFRAISSRFGDFDTIAYTHWQPAARIAWKHRINAWLAPLIIRSTNQPYISGKAFGGPTGDAASLRLIFKTLDGSQLNQNEFPWASYGIGFPENEYPLQSSDHVSELDAAAWVSAIAAQLYKISQDIRFLASHGHIKFIVDARHAGSSSMPHKVNPYKFEKVCSICRMIACLERGIWDVAALNSMERTLDTSWQLKHSLSKMFIFLEQAFNSSLFCDFTIDPTTDLVSEITQDLSSDISLTQYILDNPDINRWQAYISSLSNYRKA